MVALLLECRAQGLPALPVHDCLLAPDSRAHGASALMRAVARQRLGIELPVGITLGAALQSTRHSPFADAGLGAGRQQDRTE
jgi:hypothetical protein